MLWNSEDMPKSNMSLRKIRTMLRHVAARHGVSVEELKKLDDDTLLQIPFVGKKGVLVLRTNMRPRPGAYDKRGGRRRAGQSVLKPPRPAQTPLTPAQTTLTLPSPGANPHAPQSRLQILRPSHPNHHHPLLPRQTRQAAHVSELLHPPLPR